MSSAASEVSHHLSTPELIEAQNTESADDLCRHAPTRGRYASPGKSSSGLPPEPLNTCDPHISEVVGFFRINGLVRTVKIETVLSRDSSDFSVQNFAEMIPTLGNSLACGVTSTWNPYQSPVPLRSYQVHQDLWTLVLSIRAPCLSRRSAISVASERSKWATCFISLIADLWKLTQRSVVRRSHHAANVVRDVSAATNLLRLRTSITMSAVLWHRVGISRV